LRRAIDERYDVLVKNNALRMTYPGTTRGNLTDIATEFLPAGSSFTRAEEVLRAAGFKLNGRGREISAPSSELAMITPYRSRLFTFESVIVTVVVYSHKPNLWNTVCRVSASINLLLP
jgi:hypothetical protein